MKFSYFFDGINSMQHVSVIIKNNVVLQLLFDYHSLESFNSLLDLV